jgi:hypothetical protein
MLHCTLMQRRTVHIKPGLQSPRIHITLNLHFVDYFDSSVSCLGVALEVHCIDL